MPTRFLPFVNGEYYHVFNRGVEKRPIYLDKRDYQRFIGKFSDFLKLNFKKKQLQLTKQTQKEVSLLCFALMPNHFHLLVKQNIDNGISKFLKETSNSYTRYFNTRHDRVGPLFQGAFKAVHISDENQLIHLSRYIHLNPLTSYVIKNREQLIKYPWSSLAQYFSNNRGMCDTQIILSLLTSSEKYLQFVLDNRDYQKKLENIKHLTLE